VSLALIQPQSRPAQVLGKALLRAADAMGLTARALAEIVGVSEATLSRVRSRKAELAPSSKEGQLALLFLRVFRSLDTLVGGSPEALRQWLASENEHLGGAPASLLRTPQGLVHVADYLDAMRGKL
jgi:uncharacterized protein (DUF2384 family)